MGFCRRCGDIVPGERCKCGGTAVAPVVPFKKPVIDPESQDRWSKTYTSRERSTSPVRPESLAPASGSISTLKSNPAFPVKRFPRPTGTPATKNVATGSRVTDHIASTTSRPQSPLKYSTALPNPSADILPSLTPNDTTLSKVYGSVLQPKATLLTHSCASCASPFPPDATIYPDPTQSSSLQLRFLCKSCFAEHGGSKGPCASCTRPVLALKAEGSFIHAAGKFWHKRCFNCSGCFKNIGDLPMVDLVGHPSCVDCFDNCLKRDSPRKGWVSNTNSPNLDKTSNVGGLSKSYQATKTRESSPAIDELEQRLGIVKYREGSPAVEDLSQRLSHIGNDACSRYSLAKADGSNSIKSRRNELEPCRDTSHNPNQRHESPQRALSSKTLTLPYLPSDRSPAQRQTTANLAPNAGEIQGINQRLLTSLSPAQSPPGSPTTNVSSTHPQSMTPELLETLSMISSSAGDEFGLACGPAIATTPDLVSDFSDTATQSSFSELDSPPRNAFADNDVFTFSASLQQGDGSRFRRRDFFNNDEAIMEETDSQLNTPTKVPKSNVVEPISDATMPPKVVSNSALDSPSPFRVGSSKLRMPKSPKLQVLTSQNDPLISVCYKCHGPLFSITGSGNYVMIPANDKDSNPKAYHSECFRCAVCNGVFEKGSKGQATFVKDNGQPCHPDCAPREQVIIHKLPSSPAPRSSQSNSNKNASSTSSHTPPTLSLSKSSSNIHAVNCFEQSPLTAPATTTSFPRFGSRSACPGCKKSVSPMERGVIPGPQGTRWHSSCLVCGGKKERPVSWIVDRGRDENRKGKPGCGKKLDSAAKSDGEGGVWCRECMLLLGIGGSPQASPTRGPLVPTYTGASKIAPQFIGVTTIARQFTGMSGTDGGLLRQLTGSGLSPTRALSPTKQLGIMGVGVPGMRPRPKSVIGMRSTKSVDEGRGMFLVRQLTGATSNGGWSESDS